MRSYPAMSSRQRVVFLYAYMWMDREAVASAIRDLATALQERDFEVVRLGIDPTRIVESSTSTSSKLRRLWSEVRFAISALKYVVVQRSSIRAVISVDIPSGIGYVGTIARKLTRGRVKDIAWVMDLYRAGDETPSIRGRFEIAALRSAGRVVTLGDCMSELIHERFGLQSTVIPLWHGSLGSTSRHSSVPAVANDRMKVLYSGSARSIHPLNGLIHAVDEMRTTVHLDLIGSGTEMIASEATIIELGSTNARVGSRLPDAEFEAAVAGADIHIVSLDIAATGTCVPSKTYAAMAAGKPILYLGSRSGQAARDIIQAECGFVVDPHDTTEIRQVLRTYASGAELRALHGANALKFHASQRTVNVAVERWIDELDQVS